MRKFVLLALLSASVLASQAAAPVAGVYGAKGSEVYHTSEGCPAGKRIKPKNRVEFSSVDAAKKDGRRACKRC